MIVSIQGYKFIRRRGRDIGLIIVLSEFVVTNLTLIVFVSIKNLYNIF